MKTRHAGSMKGTGTISLANLPALIGPEAAAREFAAMILEAQTTRSRRGAPVYLGRGLLEWEDGHTVTLVGTDRRIIDTLVDAAPRGVTRKELASLSGVSYAHKALANILRAHSILAPFVTLARGRGGTYSTTIRLKK